MSLNRVIKFLAILFAVLAILYFVGSNILGPGLRDGSTSIINGYEELYMDSSNIVITYNGGADARYDEVIPPRVDGYKVIDDKIFVVRRVREDYIENGVSQMRILPICEYWMIDTKNHIKKKIDNIAGLSCK